MQGVSASYALSLSQVAHIIRRLRECVDHETIEPWIEKGLERAETVPWPTAPPHCAAASAACDLGVWLEAEHMALLHGALHAELRGAGA
jgi:hypothetical protein